MAANLGELWKKGTSSPLASDIEEGGLAIDVAGKKVYSKGNDGGIFAVGGFDGDHNDLPGRDEVQAHPIAAIDGLDSSLSGKEPSLLNPSADGMILSSTMAGARSWIAPPTGVTDHLLLTNIGTHTHDEIDTHILSGANPHGVTAAQVGAEPSDPAIQTHITDVTSNPHAVTAAQVGASPSDHLHDDRYYQETEFIDVSTGSTDGGKPIVLDVNGRIDVSMLDTSSFYYVGPHDPSAGTEYPDTTGESAGAFWVVDVIATPTNPSDPEDDHYYEYTTGELAGKQITVGDFMVWGTGGWGIMAGEMNPSLYYKLDGTFALTAPFAAGGQRLSNIADGVDAHDAIALGQVQPLLDDYVHANGDTMTGNLKFTHGSGVEMTTSLDALKLVMHIDPTDKLIINGGNLPVFTKGDWEFNNSPMSFNPAVDDTELMRKGEVETLVDGVDSGLATHIADVANPHVVTKAQVGLDKVENLTQDEQFFIGAY